MLTYSVVGRMLSLRVVGAATPDHRQAVLSAICNDPNVLPGSLLLLDLRHSSVVLDAVETTRRFQIVRTALGRKLGHACAVIVNPRYWRLADAFQTAGEVVGTRVGLFPNEPEAVRWLAAHLYSGSTAATQSAMRR